MSMPRTFTMLGTSRIEVLVSAAESGGAVSVIAESCGPGEGPPPHIHTREDEFLMPLEGSFDYFDGGVWSAMRVQGEFTKRGNLHTWRKGEDGPGKILVVATPGGFEAFMSALQDIRLPHGLPALINISALYGITYPRLNEH
jgi:uncharacterized cupin superfamily protein